MGTDSPNRADAFVFAMSELFPGLVVEKREAEEKYTPRRRNIAQGWMGA